MNVYTNNQEEKIEIDEIEDLDLLKDIKGSCHCGKVSYTFDSYAPSPFMVCFCEPDRKTAGLSNVNIRGQYGSLKVDGEEHLKVYACDLYKITGKEEDKGKISKHKRHFCGHCASMLYAYHVGYKKWFYPFVSSIDSKLPEPDHKLYIFTKSCKHDHIPNSVKDDEKFEAYPNISLENWHKKFHPKKK